MDEARTLARSGAGFGTVVFADFQNKGRGRTAERVWESAPKQNLLFTVILRYGGIADIPPAITLQTGLAVSQAIEDVESRLAGLVTVKWPNDVMINGRKAAGILVESDGAYLLAGIGVNVFQTQFASTAWATSIVNELASAPPCTKPDDSLRFMLLEKILARLYYDIKTDTSWIAALEKKLYMKGERVCFLEGAAGSGKAVYGTLAGLDPSGALLIECGGGQGVQKFLTGELLPSSSPEGGGAAHNLQPLHITAEKA
jgi:BirA family biotin operon repressor/biotin-[acetyl-CoA-carboxylase] ligase